MEYTLKRNRRSRSVRIIVHPDATVVVTAPWLFPSFLIKRFVAEKSIWIEDQLLKMQKRPLLEKLPSTKVEYRKHKEQARALIERRLQELNQVYSFSYNRVSIRNSKTRWGSCSKRGNLNFNYKLLFVGEKLLDYVLVHELCHLQEFNHSKKFWLLVARTTPDYAQRRAELKKYRF